MILCYTVSLLF